MNNKNSAVLKTALLMMAALVLSDGAYAKNCGRLMDRYHGLDRD